MAGSGSLQAPQGCSTQAESEDEGPMEILEVREAMNVESLLSKAVELREVCPLERQQGHSGRATQAFQRLHLGTDASDAGHRTTAFNI